MSWDNIIKNTSSIIYEFLSSEGIGGDMVNIKQKMNKFEENITDPELQKIFSQTLEAWEDFDASLIRISRYYTDLKENESSMQERLQ